ncbi:hypothetical protein J6590_031254 [Homalodisca vitripennis]|nr:hypothetical protein J6590_031254 [Homalodisca vitripennis]
MTLSEVRAIPGFLARRQTLGYNNTSVFVLTTKFKVCSKSSTRFGRLYQGFRWEIIILASKHKKVVIYVKSGKHYNGRDTFHRNFPANPFGEIMFHLNYKTGKQFPISPNGTYESWLYASLP